MSLMSLQPIARSISAGLNTEGVTPAAYALTQPGIILHYLRLALWPHPLVLDPTSPALHTLEKVRDEAHRFAVTYHKKLRTRRTIQSVLDTIPGVGPTIRTNLLRTLGSARRVRESSVAELAAVPKVTPKIAQRIYDHFHPALPGATEPADGPPS